MSENTVSLIVNLNGNLQRRAQQFSRSVGNFSRRSQRHLAGLDRAIMSVDRGLSRMGNQYIKLGTGVGVAAAVVQVTNFDAALTQLAVDADISDKKLESLKNRIQSISGDNKIRVSAGDLLTAVREITARTGDVVVAEENLRNIGLVMRATGASATSAAALIANYFEKFGIRDAQQMLRMLEESAILGKKGAFELRDLATEGNSVAAAYAATGRTGPKAIREMNAMLQVVRRTTPSAAEAATAFERMIATIVAEKSGLLEEAGIKVWDRDELAKGNQVARSVPDIIGDILRLTNGNITILSKLFDSRALRAINAFALEFRRTGSMSFMQEFLNVTSDGNQLLNDAARNADKARAAYDALIDSLGRVADKNLSAPLQAFADQLNKLDPSALDAIIDGTLKVSAGIVGVLSGYKILRRMKSNRKGKDEGPLSAVNDLKPIPVWVMNPGFGKMRMRVPAGVGKNSSGGRAGKLMGGVGKVAGPLAAGFLSYEIARALGADKLVSGTKFGDVLGRSIAQVLASLGNDQAKQALIANGDAGPALSGRRRRESRNKIEIELTGPAASRARVRTRSTNEMDIGVSGRIMEAP